MFNSKNVVVLQAKFHVGTHVGARVLSSAIPGKDDVTGLELTEHGIYVTSCNRSGVESHDIVTFNNIISFKIGAPEKEEAAAPKVAGKKEAK